jgi:predicted negative regulator of RcsB-dependent stress response
MSVYMTEAEQIEVIKKWWKRNQNVVTVILSVILLVFSGVKYWNWHQDKINQQASNAYEHMMFAFSSQDNKSIRAYAKQLLSEYKNTIYADVAHLTLAKLYVSQDKYPKAEEELKKVANDSKMSTLKQIAKIRLARILAANKSYEQALSELNQVDNTAFTPVVSELKGDIYAATGQYQQAVLAYRKAINEVQTQGMGNLFLEMKTNEVLAMTQSLNSANKPIQSA